MLIERLRQPVDHDFQATTAPLTHVAWGYNVQPWADVPLVIWCQLGVLRGRLFVPIGGPDTVQVPRGRDWQRLLVEGVPAAGVKQTHQRLTTSRIHQGLLGGHVEQTTMGGARPAPAPAPRRTWWRRLKAFLTRPIW